MLYLASSFSSCPLCGVRLSAPSMTYHRQFCGVEKNACSPYEEQTASNAGPSQRLESPRKSDYSSSSSPSFLQPNYDDRSNYQPDEERPYSDHTRTVSAPTTPRAAPRLPHRSPLVAAEQHSLRNGTAASDNQQQQYQEDVSTPVQSFGNRLPYEGQEASSPGPTQSHRCDGPAVSRDHRRERDYSSSSTSSRSPSPQPNTRSNHPQGEEERPYQAPTTPRAAPRLPHRSPISAAEKQPPPPTTSTAQAATESVAAAAAPMASPAVDAVALVAALRSELHAHMDSCHQQFQHQRQSAPPPQQPIDFAALLQEHRSVVETIVLDTSHHDIARLKREVQELREESRRLREENTKLEETLHTVQRAAHRSESVQNELRAEVRSLRDFIDELSDNHRRDIRSVLRDLSDLRSQSAAPVDSRQPIRSDSVASSFVSSTSSAPPTRQIQLTVQHHPPATFSQQRSTSAGSGTNTPTSAVPDRPQYRDPVRTKGSYDQPLPVPSSSRSQNYNNLPRQQHHSSNNNVGPYIESDEDDGEPASFTVPQRRNGGGGGGGGNSTEDLVSRALQHRPAAVVSSRSVSRMTDDMEPPSVSRSRERQ